MKSGALFYMQLRKEEMRMGVLIIIFGIINMKGDVSSLHWYHRQRVTEENRKPFARKIGWGTIIIGCVLIAAACFYLLSDKLQISILQILGTIILIAGIINGFVIIIFALIKYNKGIF